MKARLIIAAVALLGAAILGLAAPEPSTAMIYRLTLVGFLTLLAASRVVTMGMFTPVWSGEPDAATTAFTASSMSGRAGPNHYVPLFVRDTAFGPALSY